MNMIKPYEGTVTLETEIRNPSSVLQDRLAQVALNTRFTEENQDDFDRLVRYYDGLDSSQRESGLYTFLIRHLSEVSPQLIEDQEVPTESGEITLTSEEAEAQRIERKNETMKSFAIIQAYYVKAIGPVLVERGIITAEELADLMQMPETETTEFNRRRISFSEPFNTIGDFIPPLRVDLSHLKGLFEHDMRRLFDFKSIDSTFLEILAPSEDGADILATTFEQIKTLVEALKFLDQAERSSEVSDYSVDTLFQTFLKERRDRVTAPLGMNVRSIDAWIMTRTAMLNAYEFGFGKGNLYNGPVRVEIVNNPDGTDTITVSDEISSPWPDSIRRKVEFYYKLGQNHSDLPVGNTSGINQIAFRLGQLGRPMPVLSELTQNDEGKQEKYIKFTV